MGKWCCPEVIWVVFHHLCPMVEFGAGFSNPNNSVILFASLLIQSVTGVCGFFRFLCGRLLFCLGVCALSVWLFLVAFFLCATGHHFDKVLLIRIICFFKIPASRKQSCTFSELLFDSVRFILYSTWPQAAATSVCWFPTCISSGSWEHCVLITQFCTQHGAHREEKDLATEINLQFLSSPDFFLETF